MTGLIPITVDGRELRVHPEESLAAALLNAGVGAFRHSLRGEPRAPVCGMGVCFECRVQVNGATVRACLEPIVAGMCVSTTVRP